MDTQRGIAATKEISLRGAKGLRPFARNKCVLKIIAEIQETEREHLREQRREDS